MKLVSLITVFVSFSYVFAASAMQVRITLCRGQILTTIGSGALPNVDNVYVGEYPNKTANK